MGAWPQFNRQQKLVAPSACLGRGAKRNGWGFRLPAPLGPLGPLGTFLHLLAPVGSSATGAARMIHNRQAPNIQRQTQNACKLPRHLCRPCNRTAAHTPPVSHCAERLFRFHKRPSSPSARLAPARRRSCTCKPHAKPAPTKRLSRPSRSFRPRAPWRARAGTAPG